MPSAAALLNRAMRQDPPQLYEGRIHKAPDDVDDDVYVIIPDIDDQALSEPCNWEPAVRQDGLYLPAKGARCLVAFPYSGDPWVVQFWVTKETADIPFGGE